MWIWVPNHHSYSNHKLSVFHHPPVTVPKCPQILRPYQSHKKLGGTPCRCCANTVQEHTETSPVSSAEGEAQRERSRTRLDTKCLYNLWHTAKYRSQPQGEGNCTVQWETKPISYVSCCQCNSFNSTSGHVPCNCLEVKYTFTGVPSKCGAARKE